MRPFRFSSFSLASSSSRSSTETFSAGIVQKQIPCGTIDYCTLVGMYVCMYVFAYVYMQFECRYVRMYARMYVRMYVCFYIVCMEFLTFVYVRRIVFAFVRLQVDVCLCMMYVCMFVYEHLLNTEPMPQSPLSLRNVCMYVCMYVCLYFFSIDILLSHLVCV